MNKESWRAMYSDKELNEIADLMYKRIEKLAEALEFYANESNWSYANNKENLDTIVNDNPSGAIGGNRARQALEI